MIKIGFIGLGIMGESMCENIIKKSGFQVTVFDVNPDKVEKMIELGASGASSIAEVGAESDYIFIMVPRSEHVRSVVNDLIPVLKEGKTVVDMSTIEPKVTMELAEKVKATGANMADAPVVKSKAAAIAGELGIYVGGDKEVFEQIKAILAAMGKDVIHMGDNGAGISMKIIHNMLVGQIQNGVNEALVMAEKAGLDFSDVTKAISYGGGKNFYLESKIETVKKEDFSPAFSFENMHKDMGIALEMAKDLGVELPGAEHVKKVYDQGMEQQLGKEDFSASIKVVKEIAKAVEYS